MRVLMLYPDYAFALELIGLIFYAILTIVLMKIISHGNFTETYTPLFVSIPLSLVLIGGNVYYLRLQVYVFMFEVVLNSISLFIRVLSIIVTFIVGLKFVRFAV
ncbi:hypothetical protein ABK040_004492 [Willaertia magna]